MGGGRSGADTRFGAPQRKGLRKAESTEVRCWAYQQRGLRVEWASGRGLKKVVGEKRDQTQRFPTAQKGGAQRKHSDGFCGYAGRFIMGQSVLLQKKTRVEGGRKERGPLEPTTIS